MMRACICVLSADGRWSPTSTQQVVLSFAQWEFFRSGLCGFLTSGLSHPRSTVRVDLLVKLFPLNPSTPCSRHHTREMITGKIANMGLMKVRW